MYIAKLILVFCATVATAEKEENNRFKNSVYV